MIDWSTITLKQRQKAGISKRLKTRLWHILRTAQNANMRKWGSSYCWEALYRDMEEYCIIDTDKTHAYVFIDRFNTILKAYKKNAIHTPYSYTKIGLEKFNPIARIMLHAGEC